VLVIGAPLTSPVEPVPPSTSDATASTADPRRHNIFFIPKGFFFVDEALLLRPPRTSSSVYSEVLDSKNEKEAQGHKVCLDVYSSFFV
jgi:hypothetical protein